MGAAVAYDLYKNRDALDFAAVWDIAIGFGVAFLSRSWCGGFRATSGAMAMRCSAGGESPSLAALAAFAGVSGGIGNCADLTGIGKGRFPAILMNKSGIR